MPSTDPSAADADATDAKETDFSTTSGVLAGARGREEAPPRRGLEDGGDPLEEGLTIERVFSSAEEHPFEEVTWERRTAEISNREGEAIFRQEGVEFPEHFSQNATNIVASKYFYGDNDLSGEVPAEEGGRERSVRELIGRITSTIAGWGREDGYFASEEDATRFEEELTWLILNQHGSFNSPVQFNVGLGQHYGAEASGDNTSFTWDKAEEEVSSEADPHFSPQAAACFIIDIEDSIDGIWELMGESARLFKYGSGVGSDWTTLRSTKEKLSGGGTPSGPVSFMRVQDETGDTIKSGGKTRRAAIMQTLKVDHPDVEEFVEAKKKEEKKAHALIDAGYDGSFNGPAYGSVDFQNVNQSVRVTDEFMEAAKRGDTYELRKVTTGETVEEIDAAELMRKIGEGTYVCGDPGLQYKGTIDEWHTVPNTAPINSSNPCVTGDTLVSTQEEGLVPIRDLVGESPLVTGLDGEAHRAARVMETGTKPVYRLRTKSGYTLRLTGDHRVYTENRGDVRAADLTEDDEVRLQGFGFPEATGRESWALLAGLLLGDGCKDEGGGGKTRNKPGVTLTMDKEREARVMERAAEITNNLKGEIFPENGGSVTVQTKTSTSARISTQDPKVVGKVSRLAVLGEGSAGKRLTRKALRTLGKNEMRSLLRGLFTADGTVADYGDKNQYVALDSTSEELLQQVQQLLLGFGIKAKIYRNRRVTDRAVLPDGKGGVKEYDVKQVHSLRVTSRSRVRFEEEIGFMPESRKQAALEAMNRNTSTYRDKMSDPVESLTLEGEETVYDLTEPDTEHFVAGGIAVHNCSEYLHVDNSACNLASLNLRKFQKEDGSIDVKRLRAAARIFITGQEILVDNGSYPSEKIAENSHRLRPLGLGFANIGALLMSMGLPYDSDAGRAVAAAMQAIIHSEAYARSAEIAANKAIGPFEEFEKNREAMLDVIEKHRDRAYEIEEAPGYLRQAAEESADAMRALGETYGFRNSQATVVAPTGTIAFFMDCDTTGIEPDLALVKYKTLAGERDSMMKIVNQSVPDALERLGYPEEEREAITRYIEENDTIEGAPDLKEEHLPVFDCAFEPATGERSIHHMGHIKMMAAVQPFVSGSISKTINVPESAGPEEIADAYRKGWELGTKSLAIYRENSKRSQPLSTSSSGEEEEEAGRESARGAPSGNGAAAPSSEEEEGSDVVYKPVRRRLPDERPSLTHKFSIAGHEGYLTVGLYPESEQPGEIFITMAKQGSTLAGMMDAFATSVSIALQYGVPLKDLCSKFSHMRFEPSGFTGSDHVPIAKSIMDYIFRYLAIKFLEADPAGPGPAAGGGSSSGEAGETAGEAPPGDASVNPNEAAEATGSSGAPGASDGLTDGSGNLTDSPGGSGAAAGGGPATVSPGTEGKADSPMQETVGVPTEEKGASSEGLVGRTVEAFIEGQSESSSSGEAPTFDNQEDAPPCANCGAITVRSGACYQCKNCGASTGCG